MLPGGYNFINVVFWTVVSMVALGTNMIPLALSVGLGLLVLETVRKG